MPFSPALPMGTALEGGVGEGLTQGVVVRWSKTPRRGEGCFVFTGWRMGVFD